MWTWHHLMVAQGHLKLNHTHAKIGRRTDVCYGKHVFVLVLLVCFLNGCILPTVRGPFFGPLETTRHNALKGHQYIKIKATSQLNLQGIPVRLFVIKEDNYLSPLKTKWVKWLLRINYTTVLNLKVLTVKYITYWQELKVTSFIRWHNNGFGKSIQVHSAAFALTL